MGQGQAGGAEGDRHNEVVFGDNGSMILAGSTQGVSAFTTASRYSRSGLGVRLPSS